MDKKITTISVSNETRKLIGKLITGNETVDNGLKRILKEYQQLKGIQ